MADQYSSTIAKFVGWCKGFNKYAITISQYTTLYSCPKEQVDIKWRKHEDQHKSQYVAYGNRFVFWWTYYKLWTKYGYYNHPLEIAARSAEYGP